MEVDFCVIHRDIKILNILLDYNWAAKISDFGLSKIGQTNQPATYVNALVEHTFRYPDPYCLLRRTRKSDVYAIGVVLFEVPCWKPDRSLGADLEKLARWVQESINNCILKHITDSDIKSEISLKYLMELFEYREMFARQSRATSYNG